MKDIIIQCWQQHFAEHCPELSDKIISEKDNSLS